MPERLNRIAEGITSALKGTHQFDYKIGYPPVVNDKEMTELVRQQAALVIGDHMIQRADPKLTSEDMAFFLERVPGCFFWLGAGNDDKGFTHPLHNSRFDFDEDALMVGAEIMVRSALTYLDLPL